MPLQSPRGSELMQGEAITLLASAARGATAGTNGDAVAIYGERVIYTWILDVTNCDTEGTDTLDVYVDTLFGTATWVNVAHFTQKIGTDAAAKYFCTTIPENLGVATDVTTDCAVGTTRGIVGAQWRARWVIVDAGGAAASFTFSVTGYAQ